MANEGVALLALGAVGVAGWALLRSAQTSQAVSSGAEQAAAGAGRGNAHLIDQQTQPILTATSDAAASKTTSWSDLWQRDVRPPNSAVAVGGSLVAADSQGRTVKLTLTGYEPGTYSTIWQSPSGTHRIPWDTAPQDYFWDRGVPHGGDAGAAVKPSALQVRQSVSYATGADAARPNEIAISEIGKVALDWGWDFLSTAGGTKPLADGARQWLADRIKW
ncbi:MAG: hypothetical protein M0R73_02560 [Dehalococcoidia bacterium]|nr:hypothetical protein [Dehalococcoidia bacterium]